MDGLKNFGFADELTVREIGINGKMNELQAAFGCLQLAHFPVANARRRGVDTYYRHALAGLPGIHLPPIPAVTVHNYGYFPIRATRPYPLCRDGLYQRLRDKGVIVRRYFYPLISTFPMYRHQPSATQDNLPVAHRIADQVLCLPMYAELSEQDCARVVGAITLP